MNKNVVYIIGLLMMVTSCSDFLEPKSQSEFVPKNAVSLNEMLLGDAYPNRMYQVVTCFLCRRCWMMIFVFIFTLYGLSGSSVTWVQCVVFLATGYVLFDGRSEYIL